MMLRVDSSLPLPVYEQIREQVVRMVAAGILAPGARMPTIRQLASDLKLAKGTVAKAYALLEESKVLETLGQRGSFVLPQAQTKATVDEAKSDSLADVAEGYVIAAKQLGIDLDSARSELERQWERF